MQYIEIEKSPAAYRVTIRTPEQYAQQRYGGRVRAARAAKRRVALDRVFATLSLLSFLVMLGGAGGADCGTLTPGQSFLYSAAGLVGVIVFTYLAGGFYGQRNGRP